VPSSAGKARSLDKGEGAAWRRVWAAIRGYGNCRSTIWLWRNRYRVETGPLQERRRM